MKHGMTECPRCHVGQLVQLADPDRDMAYCPVCGETVPDCIAGRETEVKENKSESMGTSRLS